MDAKNSIVTLGSDKAYIDLHAGKNITNDGFSFRQNVKEGTSSATLNTNFEGDIKLTKNSNLIINNAFKGGINSDISSTVTINSDINLNKDSAIASSIKTDNQINISDVKLTLSGIQSAPSVYDVKLTELTGNNSGLTIAQNAQFSGNIKMTGRGVINFGELREKRLLKQSVNRKKTAYWVALHLHIMAMYMHRHLSCLPIMRCLTSMVNLSLAQVR